MGVGSLFIALVTQPTRLEGLMGRWATKSAAKFRFATFRKHERERRQQSGVIESASIDSMDDEADFAQYESEDQHYKNVVRYLRDVLNDLYPVVLVEKNQLPNFLFLGAVVVVVVGQDGLVANTAKYAHNLQIIGVNPNLTLYEGILLPFSVEEAKNAVERSLRGKLPTRDVTLAEVLLNDGQRMLAFNDFFIGRQGHASARYTLRLGERAEAQSSSGMIVATGAGATGWMSSVMNMARGVAEACGSSLATPQRTPWDARQLDWAVREPFASKYSSASMVYGNLMEEQELVIESLMPEHGIIFSDGIEQDFLEFNSGVIARFRVARQRAILGWR
jgi:NAD kinase